MRSLGARAGEQGLGGQSSVKSYISNFCFYIHFSLWTLIILRPAFLTMFSDSTDSFLTSSPGR